MNSIYYKGLISAQMFSLSLLRSTGTSKIHLGGFSTAAIYAKYTKAQIGN